MKGKCAVVRTKLLALRPVLGDKGAAFLDEADPTPVAFDFSLDDFSLTFEDLRLERRLPLDWEPVVLLSVLLLDST